MRSKIQESQYPLLPVSIILSAIEEDPDSIKIILKHYSNYICSLCLYCESHEEKYGQQYMDEHMCKELESKLISAILKFEIR